MTELENLILHIVARRGCAPDNPTGCVDANEIGADLREAIDNAVKSLVARNLIEEVPGGRLLYPNYRLVDHRIWKEW